MDDEILYAANQSFLEDVERRLSSHGEGVDAHWQSFFAGFADFAGARENGEEASSARLSEAALRQTLGAYGMIRGYRARGHLSATLDPLGLTKPLLQEDLDPHHYGFSDRDGSTPIFIGGRLAGLRHATLNEIVDILRRAYGGNDTVEYMHVENPEERLWIQGEMETQEAASLLSHEKQKLILRQLMKAEILEHVLQRRHPGSKRFGLEGSESFIVAMNGVIDDAAARSMQELVLGMAHRGRINALAHVVESPLPFIFGRFQGGGKTQHDEHSTGDVLYHAGVSVDKETQHGSIHLSLVANPSHLECVSPVVLGKVRARQEYYATHDLDAVDSVLPLLVHGDASYAGQGIVSETFDLSDLDYYRVGGAIHIIINNQIGFTTAPSKARSSRYCSDKAKAIGAPIFHVNGDDPEAVLRVMGMACAFRARFHKDVVVDLMGYRRHGHSEIDDPTFTQPLMYRAIKNHPTVTDIYAERLMEQSVITESQYKQWRNDIDARYSDAYRQSADWRDEKKDWLQMYWSGFQAQDSGASAKNTGVNKQLLRQLGRTIFTPPSHANLHGKAKKLYEERLQKLTAGKGIDWGTAELLAFATLLHEGTSIRMSGEDSVRGTFSSRHAALVDQETGEDFMPLRQVRDDVSCDIIDSPLMELGVLGFEYGYSLSSPRHLVLWEAQFGDFANGAQVIFDQFLTSSEAKWLRMSGLVVLLPHGYDGQGPDHSSARLERYLQQCAADNIQIANCTTPANYFHLLRRQMHRPFRKPLIVMTPKSLLRHKECVSDIGDFAENTRFHRLLDDGEHKGKKSAEQVTRIIFCCGKIYYDLHQMRVQKKVRDCALIRFEQLYPFAGLSVSSLLQRYPLASDYVWCQEEPENMGAWRYMRFRLTEVLPRGSALRCVSRAAAASAAVGQKSRHEREQQKVVHQALGLKGE